MLSSLKEEVFLANIELPKKGLVTYTWGNVSGIDRNNGIVAIKPSGIEYEKMTYQDIVLIDLNGKVIEGNCNPSTDAPTHLELYKNFSDIGGITHTHSTWATSWAQAQKKIKAYGSTHADYFYGLIPCTRILNENEISLDYEKNAGKVIVETFVDIDYNKMQAVLVASHGPFTWGKNAMKSVENSVVLEEVAKMAALTININNDASEIKKELLDKHFLRKHGLNAYYGQR